MDNKYLLTPEDIKQLKEEIKNLKEKLIPEYAKLMKEARADGDLRENEPFQIMREKLADAKIKLAQYQDMLKKAKIVRPKKDTNKINLGDSVLIEVNGNQRTITIVSEIKADPANNKFPTTSPIAQAVLGAKVGDTTKLANGSSIRIIKKVE